MQARARLRRVALAAAWIVAAVALLIGGVFLAVLAVNRHDRPPSREAVQMASVRAAVPEVRDADNGYLFMLGFAAPRGTDPWRVGAERARWIRSARGSDPYAVSLDDVWKPEFADFFSECPYPSRQRECFEILSSAGPELEEWLTAQSWVLERYETLLGYRGWRAAGEQQPYPALSNALSARRAWQLRAWAAANAGDAAGVRDVLGKELAFWRFVLAESSLLQTKIVAASVLQNHFARSSEMLKRLPADRILGAVPVSWRRPFSAEERSLRRVFAYELDDVHRRLERFASAGAHGVPAGIRLDPPGLMERLDASAAAALIQPQDSVNKQARLLTALADALDGPYERVPAALERAKSSPPGADGWHERLYNPIGDGLRRASAGVYADYAARIGDLEGARRAALLAVELRSRGIEPAEVEAALAAARIRHPYTGGPFAWDAERGMIVFHGIARAGQGRYAFGY